MKPVFKNRRTAFIGVERSPSPTRRILSTYCPRDSQLLRNLFQNFQSRDALHSIAHGDKYLDLTHSLGTRGPKAAYNIRVYKNAVLRRSDEVPDLLA